VLARRISNTLEADFCVEALNEAVQRSGPPEIMNTDQGSQAKAGIGRWIDFYNHQRPHAAHGGQPPAVV
jgi:putative transposase